MPATGPLAEQPWRDSSAPYRIIFDHAPIGQALVSLEGRYLQVNRALCEFLGYSEEHLRGLHVNEVTHPDDVVSDGRAARSLLAGELAVYSREKRYLTATGGVSWGATSVSVGRRADGSPLVFISQVLDINERRDQQRALAEERARLRESQCIGRLGSWEMDLASGAITWSESLFELYGLDPSRFSSVYDDSLSLVHPDDFDDVRVALRRCATTGVPMSSRHRVYRADNGELRWFEARGVKITDEVSVRIAGTTVDVTEQVLAEARLEHAALYDPLTGLPNRRLVLDRLGQALDRPDREGAVAVLSCDLDGFKRVNEVQTHHAGDRLLVETAVRLQSVTRSGDTVGRMGGDEFVVVCGVARGEDPASLGVLVAERIKAVMSEPIDADGHEYRMTVSTGICLAYQGDDADTVLQNADVAMSVAKSRGRNGHAVFDAALRRDAVDRHAIERQVRAALDDGTLVVHYQPIVEPGTGRVRAVEALMRVPDGTGGYLDTFKAVTVAEQAGIIAEIGERVLEVACAQVARWRRQRGHRDLTVSVNRSAAELSRPGLYDGIRATLATNGLPPGALTIEITENVLLDASPGTITDLERLQADGVGIAIDDFGTGYASLHYLATLPVTSLKVDQTFTAGLPEDPVATTILFATVGLAADLGIGCVVEGVETAAQLDALPISSRLLVQGYLYSRPRAADGPLPTHLTPARPSQPPRRQRPDGSRRRLRRQGIHSRLRSARKRHTTGRRRVASA